MRDTRGYGGLVQTTVGAAEGENCTLLLLLLLSRDRTGDVVTVKEAAGQTSLAVQRLWFPHGTPGPESEWAFELHVFS